MKNATKNKKKSKTLTIDAAVLMATADLIGLVVHGPPQASLFPSRAEAWAIRGLILEAVITWEESERARATKYAQLVHLAASDNDEVRPGKKPKCLAKLEAEVAEVFAPQAPAGAGMADAS